ncbi:hypothetical protein RFI_27303, partial [Reticulomyxa filosa]
RDHPYQYVYYLTTGGRTEILVKCNASGTYDVKVVDRHWNSTMNNYLLDCLPTYAVNTTLFTINVNSSIAQGSSLDPKTLTFPPKTGYIENIVNGDNTACAKYNATKLFNETDPHYLGWIANPDPFGDRNCSKLNFKLNNSQATIKGRLFGMNGQYFRHDISLATLEFNKTYEMDIRFSLHPFHHHINPFQLTEDLAYGFLGQNGEWRDTITTCNATKVRVRTADFKGKVLMHCHYLPHEDRGLMGYYNISDSCTKSDNFLPITPVGSEVCGGVNTENLCVSYPPTLSPTHLSGSLMVSSLSAIMFALFMLFGAQLFFLCICHVKLLCDSLRFESRLVKSYLQNATCSIIDGLLFCLYKILLFFFLISKIDKIIFENFFQA